MTPLDRQSILNKIRGKLAKALNKEGARIVAQLKTNLGGSGPSGTYPGRDTGELQSSTAYKVRFAGNAEVRLTVSNDAPHASLLEFGTDNSGPLPFMRTTRSEAAKTLIKNVGKLAR